MSESDITLNSIKSINVDEIDKNKNVEEDITTANGYNHRSKDLKTVATIQQVDIDAKHKNLGIDIGKVGKAKKYDKEQSEDDGKEKTKMVGFFQLFRFADKLDILLMTLGTIGAITLGVIIPVVMILYGRIIDHFVAYSFSIASVNNTNDSSGYVTVPPALAIDIYKLISHEAINFCILAAIAFVTGSIQITLWMISAERQITKARNTFFHSVLQKHIGWFDVHSVGSISSRFTTDILTLRNGISDKMAVLIQYLSTFVAGNVIGFITGWKLTLVVISFAPLIAVALSVVSFALRRMTAKENTAYGSAGAIAEEVLSSIRTVVAFGGEEKEVQRYSENLNEAKNIGIRKGFFSGMGIGMFWTIVFGSFGVTLWYGSVLIGIDQYTGGDIIIICFVVVQASMALGNAAPNIEATSQARVAATKLYETIDEETEIDPFSKEGVKPEKMEGNIKFENVSFAYPTRPDVQVLKDISFKINVGHTVALVGHSGCGKSTTVQLLQRFYDVSHGNIYIDGYSINELNIRWFREHIGIVSQEPVLFNTTIAENISYGLDGATSVQIEQAARDANAHSFIQGLPQKYDTTVGERGAQLSGGQKQRIAIARAIVRNPKILLLDESTSALDSESEALVQEALEKASKGRTTIVIAHRLSTIQNADLIIGMDNGEVVEIGTHHELMASGGLYYQLVINQSEENDENGEEDELKFSFARENSHALSHHSVTDTDNKDNLENIMNDDKELTPASLKRIMQLNSPEWVPILFGCILAILTGACFPALGALLGTVIGNFGTLDSEKQLSIVIMLAGGMAGTGCAIGFAMWLQQLLFAVSGENLTVRMRKMAFSAMLKQEMAWYDDPKHTVGAMTTRLSGDAARIKGAAGPQLGVFLQAFTTVVVSFGVAFAFGWKLALVVIGFLPLLILVGTIQGKLIQDQTKNTKEALEDGGRIATETLQNIRTVASLCKEETFEKLHASFYIDAEKKVKRQSFVYALLYGLTQSVTFFCYAASLTFGSWLVSKGDMEFENVFRVFYVLMIGGLSIGRASAFGPDYGKAKAAAANLFAIIDKHSDIDPSKNDGLKPESCNGEVIFDKVTFSYPTRSDVNVLADISIQVKPGETVALVGSSGCGKSTTLKLIDRYYDTVQGNVNIAGYNCKDLNIQWLRSQIGIVSQEPVLFDMSIKENIAYGDNSRDVPMVEIINAAKLSNIHSFIESLPLGYETKVGARGTQLSGGQKQRVAIARAVLRNPKILLLDEATSALDTESEKIVQAALDQASNGRTCIVIAHRLSTIYGANKIIVMQQGQVIEEGTHQELIADKGFYAMLNEAQKLRN